MIVDGKGPVAIHLPILIRKASLKKKSSLCSADNVLISLNESMNLIERIEEMGDASLSPLYIRLSSLIPSSSLERDITVSIYSICIEVMDIAATVLSTHTCRPNIDQ